MNRIKLATFTTAIALFCASAVEARVKKQDEEPAPLVRQIVKIEQADATDQPVAENIRRAYVVRDGVESAPANIFAEINVENAPSNIEAGGPWIGIQFGPVSRPLAKHLRLETDAGQMVLNVLKGSPAEMASIGQYDVITQIDGQTVSSDLGAFLDIVRSFQPGETHTLTVLRGGQLVDVNLVVGTRPDDAASREYLFEDDLGHVARGNVFKRGGIMMKDDDGNWTMNKLGDGEFEWNTVPGLQNGNFEALLEGIPFDGHANTIFESAKGQSVRIEIGDDGKVNVTKTTKGPDGEDTTTDTYDSMEAYKAENPDANVFSFRFDADGADHQLLGNALFFNPDEDSPFLWKDGAGNIDVDVKMEKLNSHLKELLERSDDMMKRIEINVDSDGTDAKTGQRRFRIMRRIGDGNGQDEDVQIFTSKVATSFKVAPNGSITLTTRDGDAELVQEFDNADQLKAAMPDYYDRYANLLDKARNAPAE